MTDFNPADWRAKFEQMRAGFTVDDESLDDTSPTEPMCPDCQGTGYVRYDVPVGDPRFGRMFPCPNPECPSLAKHRQQQAASVMTYSTWEADYGDLTFDSFVQVVDRFDAWNGKRGAYAAAQMFASNNQQPFSLPQAASQILGKRWPGADDRYSTSVVLTGDVGLGKTGLAVAAVNHLRLQSKPVVFIRVLELIKRIQETYDLRYEGESGETRRRFYSSVPYLVLDEFGIKNYKEDRLEILEAVIRDRDRARLPFLITTNLNVEQVYELWQPQIADIVAKAHWVTVAGVKLRQTTRKAAAEW